MNMDKPANNAGRIIAVEGPVVDVQFGQGQDMPDLYEAIDTRNFTGEMITLEVVEHLENNVARCIALGTTLNLQYDAVAVPRNDTVRIPMMAPLIIRKRLENSMHKNTQP